MNTRPISEAKDSDLRLSQTALERAAKRARELAAQTGTELIISHNGVIEHISVSESAVAAQIQEPNTPYGKKT